MKYKVFLFLMLFVVILSCSTNNEKDNDSVETRYAKLILGKVNDCIYDIDTIIESGNRMAFQTEYYIFWGGYNAYDRCSECSPITCLQRKDTAVSIMCHEHFQESVQIIMNTPDSFLVINTTKNHIEPPVLQDSMDSTLRFITQCKITYPTAIMTKNGVSGKMRNNLWIAYFSKEYQPTGVNLRGNNKFSLFVLYPRLSKLPLTEEESRQIADEIFPPYLIYSFPDFMNTFCPDPSYKFVPTFFPSYGFDVYQEGNKDIC